MLQDRSRFKSLIIHRKAGKTALALNKLIIESQLNPNKTFWYIAPTAKQAKEIIWKDPEMLKKYLPPEIVSKKNDTELTIYFTNGAVLSIKGADDPDSLRGPNPFGTVLDEYAQMKHVVWQEILYPITITNPEAWVWFIGTPKPTGEHFRRLNEEATTKEGWFSLTLPVTESGILTPDQIEVAKKEAPTQASFEQEFMCQWLGEKSSVFRGIDRCIDNTIKLNPVWDGRFRYQFGVDLAMHVDWTVAAGVNRQTHKLEVWDRYNQIDYNLQKARIEAMLRRYGNAGANVDQTGVGEPIVQDLQARGLNINGVQITAPTKQNLITNLAMWIEQGKIKFPNIPELVEELRIFGYEVLPSGKIRYAAPDGFHDDCVMALALAVWNLGSRLAPADIPTPQKVKFQFSWCGIIK